MSGISAQTAAAAEATTRRIVGPTILLGDGSYFDYLAPESTQMTLEDYAWGLASNARFRGQSRHPVTRQRCLYFVAQHCYDGAVQMLLDGRSRPEALAFLMHESDEVPLPDVPGPAKPLLGDVFKPFCKGIAAAINAYFRVPEADPDLLKRYDVRMLATEKRDLMHAAAHDDWSGQHGLSTINDYGPFFRKIMPMSAEISAFRFMALYRELGGFEPTVMA